MTQLTRSKFPWKLFRRFLYWQGFLIFLILGMAGWASRSLYRTGLIAQTLAQSETRIVSALSTAKILSDDACTTHPGHGSQGVTESEDSVEIYELASTARGLEVVKKNLLSRVTRVST